LGGLGEGLVVFFGIIGGFRFRFGFGQEFGACGGDGVGAFAAVIAQVVAVLVYEVVQEGLGKIVHFRVVVIAVADVEDVGQGERVEFLRLHFVDNIGEGRDFACVGLPGQGVPVGITVDGQGIEGLGDDFFLINAELVFLEAEVCV